jgi:hypothetical protein
VAATTATARGRPGQRSIRGVVPPRPDPGQQAVAGGTHPRLGNAFGKLRWCTERRRRVVEFYLALAHAIIIVRRLVRRAWSCYRWQARPGRRP